MKKSDLTLTTELVRRYCKQENWVQQNAYPLMVTQGEISSADANINYLIIRNLGEWMKQLEQKGYTYAMLDKMIRDLPDTRGRRVKQTELFKQSQILKK